ncbi:BRO-N domain-containing protein [Bacillus cereus]|uniref:BRO-N domain-containing protein n=1 Tax=Bacillus cereus TaxID=1396 RepID=UPI00217E1CB5|nr:Bro-N domain-containing protein [Bacillus cereus]MCS6591595.1 Bro-N domain-containing protein [Bacillus cereus]
MERDNLVNQVEVLERVKNLLLLPELEMATASQVADFYGVEYEAIKKITHRHKDELELDGYKSIEGKEIKEILVSDKMSPTKIELRKGHFVVVVNGEEVKVAYRNVALFPKRAILRVGMLLRDSEVAKEVRTQLLNIEEHTATEVKTYEIDYEQEVLGRGFKVYGTVEEPLFLAKDVAEWIDHTNLTMMLKSVDEEEKVKISPKQKLGLLTSNNEYWFITEDGIYELLMLSRKPIAKQWKKEVELPEEGSSFVRSVQIYLVSYFET